MIHEYAAIDPMALLFPSRLYNRAVGEAAPARAEIGRDQGSARSPDAEERKYILVRARMLSTYSKAVEEAVGSMRGGAYSSFASPLSGEKSTHEASSEGVSGEGPSEDGALLKFPLTRPASASLGCIADAPDRSAT